MDFAKKYWTTIRVQMEGLPAATKLLIGSLVVIMLLVGFIALLYAGKSETVPISRFAASRSEEVAARLDAAGIEAELKNGQVYVAASSHMDAIALLAREDMLSENASAAFADITGNPWETDAQGDRKYLLATQQYLNAVARKFKGVRSAEVVISLPERVGFGRSSVRPSASVTVTMNGNGAVDSHLVTALAGLVSGAVSDLRPQDVVVLDANQGRQHTVADKNDIIPTEVIELVRHQEDYHRKKIEDLYRNSIQGMIVAVKVSTNPIRHEARVEHKYMDTEPLESEESNELISKDYERAGEPGARPNTTLSIDSGGGLTRETTETMTRSEFGEKKLTSTSQIEMAGHQIEQINVTINVPRSYFVNIYKARNPEAEGAPGDEDIEPIQTEQLDKIKQTVAPLIAVSADAPGVIEANMVYDMAYLQPDFAGAAGGGGGMLGAVTNSNTLAMLSAGALGVISLAFMFMLVRKATRPEALPTVDELAGVPPMLPTDDELIGEADEVEASMAGLEVNEEELRTRNLATQISEMIKNSPDDAGGLLGKWVQAED